ncbi:hypothetical protein B0H17DRAFT_639300 [Mycena rosella]|uniref:G-protein coupled receptors family 2 profile 2 domain-containing protein n=1 Tax=Mycena rosella TaxID=1033263 RepID=A0AAD7DEL4_MYCRO|nr:hypothetical protein B0H17DRAFT_639300 [Mycena rosella]
MSPRMHTPTSFDAHIPDLILGYAIFVIAFISLILGGYAWAAWNPISRKHLDRVSFRLLVCALVANLIYDVTILCGAELTASAACNFSAFAANSCLMFAGIMFSSMALNLQLVVVHGVNGQKMERYYLFVALVITAACDIPPYAAGALGFWDGDKTCWFNSPSRTVQLQWFLGTQAFWLFLMSTCEVISFLTIVGYMIIGHRLSSGIPGTATPSLPWAPTLPKPPIVLYRAIIIRIGLYPLVSCFLNITGCILALHQVQDPVLTEVNWRLTIVDILIYILRPMVYAVLAATDPSFTRALRALRRPASKTSFHQPDPSHVQRKTESISLSSLASFTDWPPRRGTGVGGIDDGSTSVEDLEFTRQI